MPAWSSNPRAYKTVMSIRAGADGRFDLHGGDEGAYEDGTDGVARAGRSIAAAPGSEEGVAMGAEDGRKRERGEEGIARSGDVERKG